ncbi:hypothetical protein SAMN05518672_111151 [Chitinophaga sp. CF118]|uniref:hypothetical protein n=1 Tax=Chitinophaga sp. CF118 TaxID=1884367 RepID=UPI0008EC912D|nr:hypothetical protein [Chitinophaga sp. CF118]SFE88171.1 hypothetical protein SAMN05518672_111151 [Chitinophaga sp. CF118]
MKQLVLFFGLFAMITVQASAQKRGGDSPANYSTAIGVRVNPYLVGFTVKHFITGPHAIEGLVTSNVSRNRNATITGLYEYNWNVFGKSEFVMYAGGGAHVGFYDRYDYDYDNYYRHGDGTYATAGLDGIFGLEYTFRKIPLVVSADLKPYFNFSGGTHHMGEEIGGISARYTFR